MQYNIILIKIAILAIKACDYIEEIFSFIPSVSTDSNTEVKLFCIILFVYLFSNMVIFML